MMFVRRVLALLAVAAIVFAAAAGADGQAGQRHFLWKVDGANGGVVFLLGTIHAATAGLYPLAPVIEDSFRKSGTLVEEIDLSKADNTATTASFVMQNGAYLNRDSVTNHLSETTRDWLAEYAVANHLGTDYIHLKPWVLNLMIGQIEAKRFGLDKEGLDLHFEEEAVKLHKPVEGFETAEFQLNMFASFSDNLQDQLLFSTLVEAKNSGDILNDILSAWKNGDPDAMENVISEEVRRFPSLQAVNAKMLDERNDAMTQKIEAFLKTGKAYFVAVGAGHLVGARGILNQLRQKDYTVQQL